MTEIYVVRHGETEMNRNKKIIGSMDSPILKSSIDNIIKYSKKLKKKNIEIIYSSSYTRARKTAEIISSNFSKELKILISRKIREVEYGDFEGKTKETIKKRFPKYHKDIDFVHPKGESFRQLYERVVKFVDSIKNKHKKILIVTHSGCIRAIYSYCNGEDFQKNLNIKTDHNSIMKCTFRGNKKKVEILP